jgi:hypothetical protein
MIRVHPQGYVGLLAVSSKVTLTNQHSDQDPDFDCGRAHFLFHRLFHRQVSRGTTPPERASLVSPSSFP